MTFSNDQFTREGIAKILNDTARYLIESDNVGDSLRGMERELEQYSIEKQIRIAFNGAMQFAKSSQVGAVENFEQYTVRLTSLLNDLRTATTENKAPAIEHVRWQDRTVEFK